MSAMINVCIRRWLSPASYHRAKNVKQIIPILISFVLGFAVAIFYSHISAENERNIGDRRHFHRSGIETGSTDTDAFLVVIIFSAPTNTERRKAIRETWLKLIGSRRVKHYFVIGTSMAPIDDTERLNAEHVANGDLLLLPTLRDGYDLLTAKLLESLKWIIGQRSRSSSSSSSSSWLPFFDFVLKVDDDSFVRLDSLYDELVEKDRAYAQTANLADPSSASASASSSPLRRLYWGYFDGRAHVKRTGKWRETRWFLCDRYLPYALGGGYVIARSLAQFVVSNADLLQLDYRSEDVSLGVWLAPLDVNRVHDVRFDTEYRSRGCIDTFLIQHRQSPLDQRAKYRALIGQERLCANGEFEQRLAYEYNWSALPSKCCVRNVTMASRR